MPVGVQVRLLVRGPRLRRGIGPEHARAVRIGWPARAKAAPAGMGSGPEVRLAGGGASPSAKAPVA